MSWFLLIKPLGASHVVFLTDGFILLIPWSRNLVVLLDSTKTYERSSTAEKFIVDNHCYHITAKFGVGIKETQEKKSYVILAT